MAEKPATTKNESPLIPADWGDFHINGHVLPDTTNIENGIIPPPPRRAMGPDRNCRQLNCPVPIAHRGGGSAEVALEAAFSYNPHVLADTTKIENGIMPPPPDEQWARPGTVDGSIGRFLLPVGEGLC